MAKRKTRKIMSTFVDIEAGEDTSHETESSEYEGEDIDGISSTSIEHRPERDWHKFTDDLAKKYITEGDSEIEEDSIEVEEVVHEDARVPQYSLLPTIVNPRLWIVRVARGKEKDICLRLFNSLNEDTSIISIVAKPDLHGYIYIEAYTKQSVLDALANFRFVYRTKISAVPLIEMVDVLTIKGVDDIVTGTFVRVKKGKYKDDVAQIIKLVSSEMVRIRIVPRIDNVQKKFDESSVDERTVQTKMVDKKKVCIYKKEIYVDGFLEKDVMINSLCFNVDVSFDEARVYEKKRKFNINEKVKVRRGDFINMLGIIKNIERNEIEMDVDGEIYRMNIDDVEKGYCVGDEISYNQRNAVIVKKVKNDVHFIHTDTFGEEGVADIDEIEPPITQKKFEVVRNMKMLRTKRDPYLNQSVQIYKGDYKGYFGVVKDVYKESCRILLDSNLKYVNVDRQYLGLKESYSSINMQEDVPDKHYDMSTDIANTNYNESKTPSYRQDFGKTPNLRHDHGKTPNYRNDYKTPNYRNDLGKTPNYRNDLGKTPNYRNDFSKTPSYRNESRKTPNYRNDYGKTPNYRNDLGKTPNYRNDQSSNYRNTAEYGKTPNYQNDFDRNLNQKDDYSYNANSSMDIYSSQFNQSSHVFPVDSKTDNPNQSKNSVNVLVKINGQERILKEIKDDKYILDDNKEYSKVDWVYPEKYDKVRVMQGNNEGYLGVLIGIENNLGIVRDDNGDVKNVKLDFLTKSGK